MGPILILNIMAENDSNMIDLVLTHLTHPWGPPWTLATLGDPWRPLATCLKMAIFGESAHFQVPKNGTLSARIQNLRPLFHANIPPKWWSRCLFYSFTTFERVISEFNIGKLPH